METARELPPRLSANYTHFHGVGRATFPLQSTQASHQPGHVPERAATWTAQRNCGSRTSYEERNVPSGQGAGPGTVKFGVRQRMLRSTAWMLNAAAQSRTDPMAQHRRGGWNHNVETARELQPGSSANNVRFRGVGRATFPLQSTQASHQHGHVPERAATWTAQRNRGSRTSYEERNVPSGQGAWQGTVKFGVRPWALKRRAWMLNALAKRGSGWRHRNVAVMGDRTVEMNHNVAVMGDRTVQMNQNAALMGDVTISQKKEEKTEGNVCSIADETTHQNHDEALMGDVVTICQKKEVKTEGTVHSTADETAHQNHDEALMEDVVIISQKKEEKTEGTVRCAADETTPQNHDEAKERKSVSAAGLKSKTENKEQDDADFCFLQSLIPDMKKLSGRKKLKFKELVISSIGQLLEED